MTLAILTLCALTGWTIGRAITRTLENLYWRMK